MIIKDLFTLRRFFKKIKFPIFGVGVYAFNRLGPEGFLDNYRILSLYHSKETELIKKDLPVFCLEEKIGKRLTPKNSSTLLSHPETQRYIQKHCPDYPPVILAYRSFKAMEKLAKRNKWRIAVAPYFFGKRLFENKIRFRRILQKIGIPVPSGRIVPLPLKNSHFYHFKKEFGLPFVIQYPTKGGGKGTFFIREETEFKKVREVLNSYFKDSKDKSLPQIIVAEYIKGPSPSITGCVTKFGILSTRPQYQICDISLLYSREATSGLFCGHDWSSSVFSKRILSQAKQIVEKVGNYFKRFHYQGIFGLDFVLDKKEERLYVTECNPRLLGSFPTLTMIQLEKGEPPIIGFHLLEYLAVPYEIDIKKINSQLWEKKEGAQMILHSPFNKKAIIQEELEAGIYQRTSNKQGTTGLDFVRPGYNFSHLKNKKEFLFTEGLLKRKSLVQPYQRLVRIITKGRVLNENLDDILPETKSLIKLVFKKLNVKFLSHM